MLLLLIVADFKIKFSFLCIFLYPPDRVLPQGGNKNINQSINPSPMRGVWRCVCSAVLTASDVGYAVLSSSLALLEKTSRARYHFVFACLLYC